MKQWLCIVGAATALALGPCGAAMAGPFEDGQAAYDRGDYSQALQLWRAAAETGDARSEQMIGLSYELGRGVPRDDAMAAAWYRRAANQGLAEAEANLGALYASGRGVPENYAVAIMWWRKAAS